MSKPKASRRSAFLLNANAKSVTKKLLAQLSKHILREDLYVCHSLVDAELNISLILEKGYAYVFCGGGDGTAVLAINLIQDYGKKNPHAKLPAIGVLRLGTGNALGRFLDAGEPEEDVQAIVSGKSLRPISLSMIEANNGQLTPFAGLGYDGELMNDFESIKDVFFESPFRKIASSVLGFAIAGIFKTIPRQIDRTLPMIRVNSSYPAYRIIEHNGVDEEIFIEEGDLLYDDRASVLCVGTIPSVGYGITMFPFAHKRPGYMQLRISAVPLAVCISNLYPGIWLGTFRHRKLFDFLVKDVSIESEESLPYHLGGDAMGYKKQLYFRVSKQPTAMVSLQRSKKLTLPRQPLVTPLPR